MKIEGVKIQNCYGIREAQLRFAAVNLVFGGNGQSKSSLCDTLQTVFTGGICSQRGIDKKKDKGLAAHNGGKMVVNVETDGGQYSMTNTTCGKGPLDAAIAEILFNPQAVLTMTAKDRQSVFGAIFRHSSTSDKIEEYLSANNGWEPEVYDMCRGDLDDAQKWAVEQRRESKRVRKEIEELKAHGVESVLDLDGKTIDLTKIAAASVDAKKVERTRERDKLIKIIGEPQAVDGLAELIEACNEDLKGLDNASLEKDLQDARIKHGQLDKDHREAQKQASEAKAVVEHCKKQIRSFNGLGKTCPTCKSAITDELTEKVVNMLGQEREKAKKSYDVANKKAVKLGHEWTNHTQVIDKIKEQIESAASERKSLGGQITEAQQIINQEAARPENTAKLQDLDDRLKRIDDLKAAKVRYDQYALTMKDADARIEKAEAIIEQMDRLDALLKPDGELRKIANEDIESGAEFDNVLTTAWGMESLNLAADGMITFNDRPIEMASTSEQFRAGVLLAELLGRTIDAGVLVIDGIDIMEPSVRRPLNSRLPAWMKHFQTIILLCTSNKPDKMIDKAWLKYFWAENGTIVELNAGAKKAAV